MGPNETSKLLHSKRNRKQDEETTLGMGENICKWNNQHGINLQNIQTAYAAQYLKNKQTNQKNGQKNDTSTFVLSQDWFGYLGSFMVPYKFYDFFLLENVMGTLIGIALNL